MTRYLLLYGKLTSKKPKYYCACHKCGINGSCRKKEMREVQAFSHYVGGVCERDHGHYPEEIGAVHIRDLTELTYRGFRFV